MVGSTSTLLTSVSLVPSLEEEEGELLSEGVLDISLCQEPELDMWMLYSPSSWKYKQFYLPSSSLITLQLLEAAINGAEMI